MAIDEMWTFVARKKDDFWVWLALSRRNLQVIGFFVGGRDLKSAQELWEQVPVEWKQCLVFTDAYPVYERLLAQTPLQHCVGTKSGGYASVVEGANNALRQGVSYLDVSRLLSRVRTSGSQLAFTGSSITGTKSKQKSSSDTHLRQIPNHRTSPWPC